MGRHRFATTEADEREQADTARITQLEGQLEELSRKHVQLGVESRAQAAIIRSRNRQIWLLTEGLRRLLLSYCALARIRPAYEPPARVLDTGTPGVDVDH